MLLQWLSYGCNSSLVFELIIIAIGMVLCIQIMIISEQLDREDD